MRIKQEDNDHNQARYSLSSLRQNPRIVRVSRTSGGKDRHSKVCTVRGLRDRRIRLSVITAVQVYDLQDRLGLSQPSKVIDWLLEAAQNDVDLLPPLEFPHGFLTAGAGEPFPGIFESFDTGSCPSRTDAIQRENLDLEKGKWVSFDQSSSCDHGFDIDHHYISNSSQSNKLYFPTPSAYNSSSFYHYNLGHLQQSQLDKSGDVTVAFPNDNLNPPTAETMSSLFPRYPSNSFLSGGQLQIFSSNSNLSKQTDHVE